ncbi:hypothetical protein MPC4_340004 [Methylocella tundrae]|uniref:Uncharacterized protein n=1 Tax=Methylocella tundrae TaxID=227605 RepID=A0A8B6M8V7_METTU|nr:hypothetical protein MPC1_12620001 [Methylocella tundrae]VTZ51248.1 hypothetical protein MPC4_340004 [Methylocella tundrae]
MNTEEGNGFDRGGWRGCCGYYATANYDGHQQ